MGYEVVPAELVVRAMQDNGYKNAAYAIAELIDNSIQAGASLVELLCLEREEHVSKRTRSLLVKLAVLDNGCGMTAKELRCALQFGNGGHLADRKGIGRFGMGLPNSSMSQGSRVEVWTWQNSPKNSIYCYLDLDEISSGVMKEVPEPQLKSIPGDWMSVGRGFADSGTLVVWSRPDRCTWRTASAIVRNSEELVGRIYRRFIQGGQVGIRLASFNVIDLKKPIIDRNALANDPLYLMDRTTCPKPFDKVAMFEPFGDYPFQDIKVKKGGAEHTIRVSFSLAKLKARQGHNPGEQPHGKHAARNLGVSIMRADRELELDPKWMPSYDPVARWIGIEVDFPPALDEVFGVTNNKQSATNLADLSGVSKEDLARKHGHETYQELKEAWDFDDDIRLPLLNVKDAIETNRGALMRLIKAQTKGAKKTRGHSPDSPEAKGTEATNKRKADGLLGKSDLDENLPADERVKAVENGLVSEGVDGAQASELAKTTVESNLKYVFGHADSNSSAFFSVRPKGGALLITLNTDHPAYDHLVELLESPADDLTKEDLQNRLSNALDGMKLLLEAWARFEDELPDGPKKMSAQEAREDWGRVARNFLGNS